MNLHQLRVFYTVANRLSFTLAAEDLVMSQPAVSLQIKALEQSLGLRLFERVANRLSLTQAGEALYHSATTMLSAEDEATRTMAELAGATRGKLVIGANTTGGMYILPPVIRDFRKAFPETEIVLHIDGTERLCERVQQNVIDLAFVGGPIENERFRVEHLCLDPLALIFSPAHAFAGRSSVSLMEVAAERFVVEANLGVAMVSSHAVEREVAAGHLGTARVADLDLRRYLEMISRGDKYFSPAGVRFREFVSAYLR